MINGGPTSYICIILKLTPWARIFCNHSVQGSVIRTKKTESFLILVYIERSRLQLGVAGTLGGLVGGAIGAIVGLLVGVVIFATVDAAGASITLSIGATVGSAVFTAIGAVLFCLIYYFCTCN